jgi:hypothetical protein
MVLVKKEIKPNDIMDLVMNKEPDTWNSDKSPEERDQAAVSDDNAPTTCAPRRRIELRRINSQNHNNPRARKISEDEIDQSQKRAKFDFELSEFDEHILNDSR